MRSPRRWCKTLPEPRYPFRVIVANNPTVNALATPGGSIVVFRGLLERTENAEELAGVLAHEIQHVMHRHSTKAILRQASAGVLMAALVGDVSAVVAFGLQSARTLGDLRYSRQAELEADRDGARMLHAAAVDPAGMVSFFQAMQKRGGDAADRGALPVNPSGGGRPPAGADGAGRGSHASARQAVARRGLERGQEDVRRAAWIRALTRAAWAGPAVSRTPSGASASSTALAMAAGGEMAPPSPSSLGAERVARATGTRGARTRSTAGRRRAASRSPSACPTGAGPRRRRRSPRTARRPLPGRRRRGSGPRRSSG